jgi:hypothetical protein
MRLLDDNSSPDPPSRLLLAPPGHPDRDTALALSLAEDVVGSIHRAALALACAQSMSDGAGAVQLRNAIEELDHLVHQVRRSVRTYLEPAPGAWQIADDLLEVSVLSLRRTERDLDTAWAEVMGDGSAVHHDGDEIARATRLVRRARRSLGDDETS